MPGDGAFDLQCDNRYMDGNSIELFVFSINSIFQLDVLLLLIISFMLDFSCVLNLFKCLFCYLKIYFKKIILLLLIFLLLI